MGIAIQKILICILRKENEKTRNIWDKVFKSKLSKICGRQPLKILKGYTYTYISAYVCLFSYIYILYYIKYIVDWHTPISLGATPPPPMEFEYNFQYVLILFCYNDSELC